MLLLGVKATHDGGVAVIDGDRLLFSLEMEKIGNGSRYSELGDLDLVRGLLADEEIDLADIDRVAVDGWGYGDLPTAWKGERLSLPVAPYREARLGDDSLTPHTFGGLRLGGDTAFDYQSFHHTTGHIMSAYCASPFAGAGQESFVVVWDGGVLPRAYYIRPQQPYIENLGPVFGLLGNVYAVFAMHMEPFTMDDPFMIEAPGGPAERSAYNARRLAVPGKVMAYTALGQARPDLAGIMDRIYAGRPNDVMDRPRPFVKEFVTRILDESAALKPTSADMLATLQQWIGERLVESLRRLREQHPGRAGNLCFAGGCALNIKWNSAIRRSGVFEHVFVPPFPNDSGSAIGAACAAMVTATGRTALEWSSYAGPSLRRSNEGEGYISRRCTIPELADLLYRFDEPIVVLHGRAELGPRALGNRSILAPATDAAMKGILNTIKRREDYRPVSPICLEQRAPEIFDPGTPDPYMLFDHQTRPDWLDRIPAVVHLDGSARLQTVNARQNPVISELLTAYEKLSGVPVLCNTSANYDGRGFFPDVESALEWGRTRYVWSEGTLWQRGEPSIEDPDTE
ncbi:carbamoyltransferase N-terminal domain-containing protein [Actinocrinis sp.]|uniref:carbamoyltransferase N-terminal domain-containing protein n=1 Tax=Actinocrinis sp. TaxID=1920516 RepID=UPI002BB15611|nr:carbamoyltransferase N-terminal domain-containing protein [Actinocrinis sp.]HXR72545.1 carbamoyltransferase N-terminal domain-containing protein [Actinocrinis sp.]